MALLAQTLKRTALEARTVLPPAFLLPFRAGITTISHNLETGNVPEPLIQSGQRVASDLKEKVQGTPIPPQHAPESRVPITPHARADTVSKALTPMIRQLLPLLRSQPAHYMTIHIHGHPYLVTKGDTVRLPFLMPKVAPGDVLRLNRATHIGSRDYTLKAPEPHKGTRDAPKKMFYLDERLFTCRATVMGVESEPLRIMEKTKRRQRHVRHVYSKHKYTILTISDMEVTSLEEYEKALEQ